MIRVEGYQNLYRDEKSGAIINCDSTSYINYLTSASRRESQKKELDTMRKEINELKILIKELVNGSK
jgi:hypothetical protein